MAAQETGSERSTIGSAKPRLSAGPVAGRETGKQRASRIPLDYFRRANPLEHWKLRLTWAAVLSAAAWWGAEVLYGDAARLSCSRGPVSSVHAMWETKCESCHEPFRPIDGKSWLAPIVGAASSSSQKCAACHVAPAHHASENPQHSPSCAGCHHEHRGREASLIRLPDDACTRCHANLTEHIKSAVAKPRFHNTITRFDRDHPEFGPVMAAANGESVDQPTAQQHLDFNHALHMTVGIVRAEGARPFTLGQIRDVRDRDRYRQADDTDASPVRIGCASCHRLDAADAARQHALGGDSAARSPRTAGSTMLPIRYETHCQACHPTTFDPDLPDRAAPHGRQPAELRVFLENLYAAQYLAENSRLLEQPVARRPLPGHSEPEEVVTARRLIREKVEAAEAILYRGKTTCGECHQFQHQDDGRTLAYVLPTNVPAVWFTHASFDHAAHRAVSCRECHVRAYRDSPQPSKEGKDVLLPAIETCRACHAPASRTAGAERGGARFDCTECHRYHNGDQPMAGLGADARRASAEFDLARFRNGTIPSGDARPSRQP